MAILKRLAMTPSIDEASWLINIKNNLSIFGLKHDDLKSKWYDLIVIVCEDGNTYGLRTKSRDVEFKFECFALSLEKDFKLPPRLIPLAKVNISEVALLFRGAWLLPAPEGGIKCVGNAPLIEHRSKVENLSVDLASACVSWVGLLLKKNLESSLISVGDFPMTLEFQNTQENKSEILQFCSEVAINDYDKWRQRLQERSDFKAATRTE